MTTSNDTPPRPPTALQERELAIVERDMAFDNLVSGMVTAAAGVALILGLAYAHHLLGESDRRDHERAMFTRDVDQRVAIRHTEAAETMAAWQGLRDLDDVSRSLGCGSPTEMPDAGADVLGTPSPTHCDDLRRSTAELLVDLRLRLNRPGDGAAGAPTAVTTGPASCAGCASGPSTDAGTTTGGTGAFVDLTSSGLLTGIGFGLAVPVGFALVALLAPFMRSGWGRVQRWQAGRRAAPGSDPAGPTS